MKIIIWLLILFGAAGAGYAYINNENSPVKVKIIHPERGDIASLLRVTGRVVNDRVVTLAALSDGEIKSLSINVGDHVKHRQLLVTFDDAEQQHYILRAKAEVELEAASLSLAQQSLSRLNKLKHSGAIAAQELDKAKGESRLARAKLTMAKENLAIAKLRLRNTKVYAPYDGIVISKKVDNGQWVESGTPLLVLASDKGREIEAYIDASDLALIKKDKQVKVSSDSYPDKEWVETIRRIDPAVEDSKEALLNSFPVRITLGKKAPYLLLNQQVDINLVMASKANILKIPLLAMTEDAESKQVLILRNGKVKTLTLKTGIESYTEVEVLTTDIEMDEHTQIILTEGKALHDGDLVSAKENGLKRKKGAQP